jgi:hypothetical protein
MSPENLRRALGDAPLPDPERQWRAIQSQLAQPAKVRRAVRPALALAAALGAIVLGIAGGTYWQFAAPAQWQVTTASGAADARALDESWFETGTDSSTRFQVGRIGTVALGAGSRARLRRDGWSAHRMELERGTMEAVINAPPRLFFVKTPTALATDLGCAYTLTVEDDGSSTLHVSVGWVELSDDTQRAIVPAGLTAHVSASGTPSIPYAPALPTDVVDALARLSVRSSASDIDLVLTALEAHDAPLAQVTRQQLSGITLWHLLQRVERSERPRVLAALEHRAPRPEGVTTEGILALDRQMLDRWRRALHPMWGEQEAPFWVAAAQRIWLWVMD